MMSQSMKNPSDGPSLSSFTLNEKTDGGYTGSATLTFNNPNLGGGPMDVDIAKLIGAMQDGSATSDL